LNFLTIGELSIIFEKLHPSLFLNYDFFFNVFERYLDKNMVNTLISNPKLFKFLLYPPLGMGYEEVFAYMIENCFDKYILISILKNQKLNAIERLSQLFNENGTSLLVITLLKLKKLDQEYLEYLLKDIFENTPNFFYNHLIMSEFVHYFSKKEILNKLLPSVELKALYKLESVIQNQFYKKIEIIIEDYFDIYTYDLIPSFYIKDNHVSGITLPYCELKRFPEQILKFTHLEKLRLSQNQLKEIPEGIRKLKYLKELNVSKNNLKKLPESIGQLTSLEILCLEYNRQLILPETITNLTSLKTLKLDQHLIKISDKLKNFIQKFGKIIWYG